MRYRHEFCSTSLFTLKILFSETINWSRIRVLTLDVEFFLLSVTSSPALDLVVHYISDIHQQFSCSAWDSQESFVYTEKCYRFVCRIYTRGNGDVCDPRTKKVSVLMVVVIVAVMVIVLRVRVSQESSLALSLTFRRWWSLLVS